MNQKELERIAEITCNLIGSTKVEYFDSGHCGIGFETGDFKTTGFKVGFLLHGDRSFDRIIVSCYNCYIERFESEFFNEFNFKSTLIELLDELDSKSERKEKAGC